MTTIQTTIKVQSNHHSTLRLPKKIKPGLHKITVFIEDQKKKQKKKSAFPKLKAFHWKNWPSDSTFSREELYGDEIL